MLICIRGISAREKTFPEAYNLLLNKSVEMLDSIFENLPSSHPAKGPYRLFSKAEKSREMQYWDWEPGCRYYRIRQFRS